MNESTQRITQVTAVFMVAVALCFDLLQLGTGILPLSGSLVAGAIGWIPLLGQLFAGWVLGGSLLLQTALGWLIMTVGYLTMGLWFICLGVPVIGTARPSQKVITLLSALLVDVLPLLNLLPGITVWVIVMVYLAMREDKAKAVAGKVGYNGKNSMRVVRRYVHANTH